MTESPLTAAQLATKLNRSVITLERWRRLRKGPPFYRLMGRVVYDEADVEAWLQAQKQATGRDGAA